MYTPCGISPEWVVFNSGMLCNHQNLPKMGIMLAEKKEEKKKGRGSISPWSLKSLTQAGVFVLHNSPKLEEYGATHARNLICKIQAALWYVSGVTIKGYENYLSCFSFIAPLNFMRLRSSSTEPMHLLSVFCDALSSSSLCLSVCLNSRMKNPKRYLFAFSSFIPSLLRIK